MLKHVVIDTNVLVAVVDSRDNWHAKAQILLTALKAQNVGEVYFDCVLNETMNVLARRSEERKQPEQFSQILDELLQQVPVEMITWISSETQRLYLEAIELIHQHAGTLNFHDALIALVCRELNMNVIISFDPDFDAVPWLKRILNPEDVYALFPTAQEDPLSE